MKREYLSNALTVVHTTIARRLRENGQITRQELNDIFGDLYQLENKEAQKTTYFHPLEVVRHYLLFKSRCALAGSKLHGRMEAADLCMDAMVRVAENLHKLAGVPLRPKEKAEMTPAERACGMPVYVRDHSANAPRRNAAAYIDLTFASVLVDNCRRNCTSLRGRLEIVLSAFDSAEDGSNLLLETVADDGAMDPDLMLDLRAMIDSTPGLDKLCLVYFLARHLDLPCLRMSVGELIHTCASKEQFASYWHAVIDYFGAVGMPDLSAVRLTPGTVNASLGRTARLCAGQFSPCIQ